VSGRPGPAAAPLKRRILEEPYRFEFFQLVRLLEVWRGGAVGIGQGGPFRGEPLRLRPDPSLAFSPADVRRVEEPSVREAPRDARDHAAPDRIEVPYRVTVNFMGLYGVAAPTPVYLTEMIGATDVDADELVDFLDLFNHRMLSLFYRAWIKYRYPFGYEPEGRDEVSSRLLGFVGLADPAVRRRTGLPTSRLLRYLGLLSLRTRPAVGLKLLLADHFGVPAEVAERVFRWVPIPPEGHNRIGVANSRLGVDLTVGERVPDRAGKIRVALGPLHFDQYLSLLPPTPGFHVLCALVRLWAGDRFDFEVELVVRREEIPEMRMGEGSASRLGWTSWATSGPGLASDPRVVFPPTPPSESRPERASP
jgi:type VI secretion system protein ImpH